MNEMIDRIALPEDLRQKVFRVINVAKSVSDFTQCAQCNMPIPMLSEAALEEMGEVLGDDLDVNHLCSACMPDVQSRHAESS